MTRLALGACPWNLKEKLGRPYPNHMGSQWGGKVKGEEKNTAEMLHRWKRQMPVTGSEHWWGLSPWNCPVSACLYTQPVIQYPTHVLQLCNTSLPALGAHNLEHLPKRTHLCCLIMIFIFSFVTATYKQ